MSRWVLHVDMDAFYASVEQLTRPTLQGRPVLVGGVFGRGVVAGCSYEARQFGAHSAMPMFQAQSLCEPRGVTVRPRRAVYAAASKRVFEVFRRRSQLVEQVSIDEAFLEPAELQGAGVEEVRAWAQRLRAEVRAETGLAASIGAGAGKQYAKIGSGEAKPDGVFIIPEARHREILYPMSVGKLWGVGPVARTKLRQIGVDTIGQLAAMDKMDVEMVLGKTYGVSLWLLARGMDTRPLDTGSIAKQISAEHTYPHDLTTKQEVDDAIGRALEDSHRRLIKDGRGAKTVTVKLKMADFHSETRSSTLPYATDDLETLKAMALRLARYPDEVGAIRLVGVGFSGLDAARQHVLFPELDIAALTRAREQAAQDNDYEAGVRASEQITQQVAIEQELQESGWHVTQDVFHPKYGHGWIQGAGHGVMTVRFETRATGPGRTKSLKIDDPDLTPADPLDSLDWEDWFAG